MDKCSICLKNQATMESLKEFKGICAYITMLQSCVPEVVNKEFTWRSKLNFFKTSLLELERRMENLYRMYR